MEEQNEISELRDLGRTVTFLSTLSWFMITAVAYVDKYGPASGLLPPNPPIYVESTAVVVLFGTVLTASFIFGGIFTLSLDYAVVRIIQIGKRSKGDTQ